MSRVNIQLNKWTSQAEWQKEDSVSKNRISPDLRKEFHSFLYGSNGEIPKGFWVIHREMLLNQESEHWDPENQETYRGYRWKYNDHLIRVRYDTYPVGRSNETDILIGNVDNPTYVFFVEWQTKLKKEDVLIEISPCDSERKPSEDQITLDRAYDIIRSDYVKGDLGRVEYIRAYARKPSPIGNVDLNVLNLVD